MFNEFYKTKGEIMIERAENKSLLYEISEENINQGLILFDNTQFIYELYLAELELKALGIDFEIIDGFRRFRILNNSEEKKRSNKKKILLFQNN